MGAFRRFIAEAVNRELGKGSDDRRLGGLLLGVSVLTLVCTVVQTVNSFNISYAVRETAAALTVGSPLKLTLGARMPGESEYADSITAKPGDILEFRLTAQNVSDEEQDIYVQIDFSNRFGGGVEFLPDTVALVDKGSPDGIGLGADFPNGGAVLRFGHAGRYPPGESVSILVDAEISGAIRQSHLRHVFAYAYGYDGPIHAEASLRVDVVAD